MVEMDIRVLLSTVAWEPSLEPQTTQYNKTKIRFYLKDLYDFANHVMLLLCHNILL